MSTQPVVAPHSTEDFMPLDGIDHVELWVGNAKQAAYFYDARASASREVAYAGLGDRRARPHLVRARAGPHPPRPHRRADARTTRSRSICAATATASRTSRSRCPTPTDAYRAGRAARRDAASRAVGARATSTAPSRCPRSPPTATRCTPSSSAATTPARSSPATSRRERLERDRGAGLLDDRPHRRQRRARPHERVGRSSTSDVFGMTEMIHFSDEAISTEYSALMSKVVTDGNGRDQVPDQRAGRGQAQVADRRVPRLLRRPGRAAHRDRHARHRRARSTELQRARRRVPRRPPTPTTTTSPERVGEIEESTTTTCGALGILVDRDDDGYLLQIFTKPVGTGRRCSSR